MSTRFNLHYATITAVDGHILIGHKHIALMRRELSKLPNDDADKKGMGTFINAIEEVLLKEADRS